MLKGNTLFTFTGEINIALGKPASQSTDFFNGKASWANDGNRDSAYEKGSCSHTMQEETNWWQVDLQGIYSIASVFIVNRDIERKICLFG